tara:strand:+ start:41 stop:385 length:345 start_codon:yes stop_codon:yes gene_type:complete
MVKIVTKLMSKYGIPKGAKIAKSMGFKTKTISDAGSKIIKRNVGKGPWKNRATPEQISVMRDAARRERRQIKGYERAMREDIRKYGTPRQQDMDEYLRQLNEEFAYLKNRKGEF